MTSGAATIAEYSYDAVGNRMQQTNGNGTSTEYAFDSDPRYRVTSVIHKHGANVLAQIGYSSRDKVGNPESMTDWTGTWGYDYDSNNRLIGATPPNPVPGQPAGGDYEYDWVGNRIHPPGGPNPMVYDEGDQLVRWPGMYRYSYDGAGNLVQVRNDSQTQVLKSYTYSPAGLLATGTFRDKDGNTRTLSNNWDADSNRVGMNANGTAYAFVYDTTAGIPAVLEESTLGSTPHYIREPGGALIARLNATNGTRYYHFDELGSTRLLTNSNGDITDRYAYDAYGSLLSHDAYPGSVQQPYQYVGRLGYYTHWMEPDFGLLQLGVRFYDPEVGRFTSKDPVRQGFAVYEYAGGSPIHLVDPSGLLIQWPSPDVFFAWHYVFGGGSAVDLSDMGFLGAYQGTRAVQRAVAAYQQDVAGHVRAAARRACKGTRSTSVITQWSDDETRQEIDTLLDLGWFTVARHSFFRKSLCRIAVNCCRKTYEFECILDFRMYDRWRDPTGLGISLGTPFDITGSWWQSYTGRGSF